MTILRSLLDTFNTVRGLPGRLTEMENAMTSAREAIDQVSTRLDAFVADVNAEIDTLKTKAGQLDDEGQAALERLSGKIDAAHEVVGDADGSETPAEPATDPVTEPTPGAVENVESGGTPLATDDGTGAPVGDFSGGTGVADDPSRS